MSTVVPRPSATHPGTGWGPAFARLAVTGTPGAAGELRVWAGRAMSACPRPYRTDTGLRERLELVVSELASNAVRHSASGRDGGFMIAALFTPHDRLALRLYDEGPRPGAPRTPQPPPPVLDDAGLIDAESGRGLALVALVSAAYGFTAPPEQPAYSVWAELVPGEEPSAASTASTACTDSGSGTGAPGRWS
ncbi:ATP-binding protein [Nocardiopsis composta]|uniref:Anti-sigma regulatory factor (Ser/Thr protein kinase) n=1 Tax=Nocardiopsis composta TaxID=157465 RepID=A0A7W8QQY7_9ACTN|nr:ATP-binding protein [Nocardiopsis composta]MBB5434295.1 anti-sigma regulatory factor (Ser/Thr protein kinase) [Nocardiopsis composta]